MKIQILLSFLVIFLIVSSSAHSQKQAIIIDHNCCNIAKVPDNWIGISKNRFRIAYGHTSHGSQIVTGIGLLNNIPNSIYTYNKGQGSLYINDASLLPGDLGNPDRTTWATRTRTVLNNNTSNINMIMWSWCGQVDGTESDINTYLNLMNQLEKDFTNITFVYMTGHLNGTGVTGNVNKRNEQIRKFCRDNGKILFDFADIESYDPDGKYFLDKGADDGCNYKGGNWADEWCKANPTLCNTTCSCAHSKCLNCQQKGKAFWWMLARVAGWEGISTGIKVNELTEQTNFNISPNPASDLMIIAFSSPGITKMNISISNSYGIEVKRFGYKELSGQNSINISTIEFPSGIYFCSMITGMNIITKSFVVLR
ncbi:MAG: type sorting protein [Ignavibacteria bacterium]|nr:type sorting protein [Ignavibacteria bacterium]